MNNGATPAFITAQFEAAVIANVPFIIGELSKYGARAGNGVSVCSTAGMVDYEWMATECQRLGIGWLAWEWGPGNAGGGDPLCTIMDMTTNNTYLGLTGWGLDLATNSTYGLITTQKTAYIQNGFKNCN
jgi:mannan endo-1,4-beta-mannosidase